MCRLAEKPTLLQVFDDMFKATPDAVGVLLDTITVEREHLCGVGDILAVLKLWRKMCERNKVTCLFFG